MWTEECGVRSEECEGASLVALRASGAQWGMGGGGWILGDFGGWVIVN
jgi:hypothetical protein